MVADGAPMAPEPGVVVVVVVVATVLPGDEVAPAEGVALGGLLTPNCDPVTTVT